MIRTTFLIGRILAALGALLVVVSLTLTCLWLANADDCRGMDCEDDEVDKALVGAIVFLPISAFVGAAGVALINDTYRKV